MNKLFEQIYQKSKLEEGYSVEYVRTLIEKAKIAWEDINLTNGDTAAEQIAVLLDKVLIKINKYSRM